MSRFRAFLGGMAGAVAGGITGALRGTIEAVAGIPARLVGSLSAGNSEGGLLVVGGLALYYLSGAVLLGGVVGAISGGVMGLGKGAVEGSTYCADPEHSIGTYCKERVKENLNFGSFGPFSDVKKENLAVSQASPPASEKPIPLQNNSDMNITTKELQSEEPTATATLKQRVEAPEQAVTSKAQEAVLNSAAPMHTTKAKSEPEPLLSQNAPQQLAQQVNLPQMNNANPDSAVRTAPAAAQNVSPAEHAKPVVNASSSPEHLKSIVQQYSQFRQRHHYDEINIPPLALPKARSVQMHFKNQNDTYDFCSEMAKSNAKFVVRNKSGDILAYSNGDGKLYNPNTQKAYEAEEKGRLQPVSAQNKTKVEEQVANLLKNSAQQSSSVAEEKQPEHDFSQRAML